MADAALKRMTVEGFSDSCPNDRLQLDSIGLDIVLSVLHARVPLEQDAAISFSEETTNRTHDER